MAFADGQANAEIVYNEGKARVTLAGTVKIGDALGFSSGWKRALATAGGVIQMRCVALEDGISGQEIDVCFGMAVIKGSSFSGATAGGALYVAESTDSGKYTQTAPSTSTDANKIVGYALSATEVIVLPNNNVDSVA